MMSPLEQRISRAACLEMDTHIVFLRCPWSCAIRSTMPSYAALLGFSSGQRSDTLTPRASAIAWRIFGVACLPFMTWYTFWRVQPTVRAISAPFTSLSIMSFLIVFLVSVVTMVRLYNRHTDICQGKSIVIGIRPS